MTASGKVSLQRAGVLATFLMAAAALSVAPLAAQQAGDLEIETVEVTTR